MNTQCYVRRDAVTTTNVRKQTSWLSSMTQAKRPFEILSRNIGNSVQVKLKGSKVFTGKFLGYDPHWNISLAEAQEYADHETTKLERVILRGNNVLYISSLDTS